MRTHEPAIFDPKNAEHIERLNKWEEKAKYSKFYKSAINIWTNKDLQKINTAKQNNLNYLPIYSNNFNEIIEIFKKYVEN